MMAAHQIVLLNQNFIATSNQANVAMWDTIKGLTMSVIICITYFLFIMLLDQ